MKTKVGVEIECENADEYIECAGWQVVPEPMLRNGCEYVLLNPTRLNKVLPLLCNLEAKFTEEVFTSRCSTHIHVDVRDLTRLQRFNFITLYVIFERLLMTLVEEDRVGNTFCVPVAHSAALEGILVKLAQKDMEFRDLDLEGWKYGSINLASVHKLGSLEFRSLHGTADAELIFNWLSLHVRLKEYAEGLVGITPADLVMKFSIDGFRKFFTDCFGKYAPLLEHKDMELLAMNGMRDAQYFAFTGDWD